MPQDFQELDEEWFRQYARTDPVESAAKWRVWTMKQRRTRKAMYKKALELGSGLSPGSVHFYIRQAAGDLKHLSESNLECLDSLSEALGVTRASRRTGASSPVPPSNRRCALLTQLQGLPSLRYHMEIISGILTSAESRNISVAVQELTPQMTDNDIRRLLRHSNPHAVIMVRVTPALRMLNALADRSLPTVLIHADRLKYSSPPVIANIVPWQQSIRDTVEMWAWRALGIADERSGLASKSSRRVVVVGMAPETDRVYDIKAASDTPVIRNERIQLIMDGLGRFDAVYVETPDYSFRHAYRVFNEYTDAGAYICLSDELAVGIRHLLAAAGKHPEGRVAGFDDSELARSEGVTSFGQHVEELGHIAIQKLNEWFALQHATDTVWPEFAEVPTEVKLTSRD